VGETPFVTAAISVERRQLVADVADVVLAWFEPIVRVAVDGVSGAGKTTFADELTAQLRQAGRSVIRASVDDFHRPKAQRYRLGRDSPDGHYLESYDYERLRRELLDPLLPGGSRLYRSTIFDCARDRAIATEPVLAQDGSILVVDGLFLNRDELQHYWDVSIFLTVPFDIAIERCARRDGSARGVTDASNRRYIVGETRYIKECRPRERASIVIDNSELSRPVRLR
jgi:uridine kinase